MKLSEAIFVLVATTATIAFILYLGTLAGI